MDYTTDAVIVLRQALASCESGTNIELYQVLADCAISAIAQLHQDLAG